MKNKNKTKGIFSPPLPPPQAQLHSPCSLPSAHSGAGGQGVGVVVSSSHLVSASPSSSHSSLAPAWGPSHRRQTTTNISNMGPSHRLQLFTNCPVWMLPTGCSPSGTGCSSVGPLWGHKSCQEPAPAQALHEVTASIGHPPALA